MSSFSKIKYILHEFVSCGYFVPQCSYSEVTLKATKSRVFGYRSYQYGVPMKDIRRARVAVIWAEIPKSAAKQKKKNIITTIMPHSNFRKYRRTSDSWSCCANLTRHISVTAGQVNDSILKWRPWKKQCINPLFCFVFCLLFTLSVHKGTSVVFFLS